VQSGDAPHCELCTSHRTTHAAVINRQLSFFVP
jgi:hypothetical protein